MFQNAGKKLMGIAKLVFFFYVLVGIIMGIVMMVKVNVLVGLLMIVVGIVSGWLSTIMLYAFGELCANVYAMTTQVTGSAPNYAPPAAAPQMGAPAQQASTFCPQCGQPMQPGAASCGNCGFHR